MTLEELKQAADSYGYKLIPTNKVVICAFTKNLPRESPELHPDNRLDFYKTGCKALLFDILDESQKHIRYRETSFFSPDRRFNVLEKHEWSMQVVLPKEK